MYIYIYQKMKKQKEKWKTAINLKRKEGKKGREGK